MTARVDINCVKAPYDPMPVVKAAFAAALELRKHSDTPIFILAGESHCNDVENLMPYAAAHYAGLLEHKTNNPALKHMHHAFEAPHNMLTKERAEFDNFFPDTIQASDSPSVQLAHMLSEYGSADPDDGKRLMFKSFTQHELSLMTVDAGISWGRRFPFLDATDALTASFIPEGPPPHHMGHVASHGLGFAIRNQLMAHLLTQRAGHTQAITWMQCGGDHLFNSPVTGPGLASLLPGHVIAVMNARHQLKPQNFTGPLVVYHNMAETRDLARPMGPQIKALIHKHAPL